jgi:D-tyrosyl-tRNA(Tyr) deacylase
MRILIQRVASASVTVDGETAGAIDGGYLLLVGVTHNDTQAIAAAMAAKIVNLRLFEDEAGQINRSLLDVMEHDPANAGLLIVSQFTLYASTKKGRRPSFTHAAPGPIAETLIAFLCAQFRAHGVHVETGRFGAHMQVSLINDGPVTIWLESDAP